MIGLLTSCAASSSVVEMTTCVSGLFCFSSSSFLIKLLILLIIWTLRFWISFLSWGLEMYFVSPR